jgi:hypothetical protein
VFVRAGSPTADPAPFLIVGAAVRVPGMLPALGAFRTGRGITCRLRLERPGETPRG